MNQTTAARFETASRPAGRPIARPLLLLAMPDPDREALGSALASLSPSEIATLLRALSFHRLDGLAHRAIGALPHDAVDPWLRASLRRKAEKIAAATLSQGLALAEILEALDRRRLAAVVMRGLRSVEWIYDDASMRPFEDHDLLVRPSESDRVRAVLGALGYSEEGPWLLRRGGVIVDLHTDPLGARRRPSRAAVFPVDAGALFLRAAPGMVAGAPALLLAPEDELLLLAVHLVKHSFDRLIRIADLAHLLASRAQAICWQTLRRRAEAAHALGILSWALDSAAMLGARAPLDLRPSAPPGLLEDLLMRRVLELRPLPYTGEVLMALAAPTLSDRLRFFVEALLPAGETPEATWRRAMVLPHRSLGVLRQAAAQVTERRQAR